MKAYEVITDRIIEALEAGTVPWHQPWSAHTDAPRSLSSGKPYRGINVLMLAMTAQAKGYRSPYWCTFNQAKARGGQVRKGEKGTPVVLWKWLDKKDKDTGENKRVPLLRYFTVFNVEQCEGVAAPELELDEREHTPLEAAELIVEGYDGPSIVHGPARAAYAVDADTVYMPNPTTFESCDSYYVTLFHELVHSTAHESRLNRPIKNGFGSDGYAREELVAEIGACFLSSEAGIEPDYDQSPAYIASWLRELQNDRRLIVTAAQQAQKAADHILGRTRELEAEKTPQEAIAA